MIKPSGAGPGDETDHERLRECEEQVGPSGAKSGDREVVHSVAAILV
jgi:hypothetical protein